MFGYHTPPTSGSHTGQREDGSDGVTIEFETEYTAQPDVGPDVISR